MINTWVNHSIKASGHVFIKLTKCFQTRTSFNPGYLAQTFKFPVRCICAVLFGCKLKEYLPLAIPLFFSWRVESEIVMFGASMQPQHYCVWSFLSVFGLARNFRELFSKHPCSSTTLTLCYTEHHIFFTFYHLRQELATLCQEILVYVATHCDIKLLIFCCCSGIIARLSLIRHSLYVRVVEKPRPPPLTGERYGEMEPEYPEGGRCQSVLRHQGFF